MSFEARYRGQCDNCTDPITPGELIKYDDTGELVHVACEPEAFGKVNPDEAKYRFSGTKLDEMGY